MALSRRAGLKAVLLLVFLLQVRDALGTKQVDQLSVQEIEEGLQVRIALLFLDAIKCFLGSSCFMTFHNLYFLLTDRYLGLPTCAESKHTETSVHARDIIMDRFSL
jgi:hypothetical protein